MTFHHLASKISSRVLARELGAKQSSLHLDPNGGSSSCEGDRCDELSLEDAQLVELTQIIAQIEGRRLMADGRLDETVHVFDLGIEVDGSTGVIRITDAL